MNTCSPLFTLLLIIATLSGMTGLSQAQAEKTYSLDNAQSQALMAELVEQVNTHSLPKGKAIPALLKTATAKKKITLSKTTPSPVSNHYTYARERTYKITTPYDCGKCDNWHSSTATAWALSPDGLIVTNYHCFLKDIPTGVGIISSDSEVFPLENILIADKEADFVIFKVKLPAGKTLKAFPLGEPAPRGDEVHLVSNPLSQSFYYSKGYVSGYAMKKSPIEKKAAPVLWMQTSLGYDKGSSGGGIFNAQGEIVGMVSFIDPRFKEVNKQKAGDKYSSKIFEYTVPISAIRNRIQYTEAN